MTVQTIAPDDGLRVILCFAFDHRASSDEVFAFKQRLIGYDWVLHSVELSGTFDFIIEGSIPTLGDYHDRLGSISGEISRVVERYEASFVCKRFIRRDEDRASSLWVSCTQGMERIACSSIDKITAERDYMRIHCGEQSWLHHTTLAALMEKLDPARFIQVHRSIVLRLDFIDRLVHQGDRWLARLQDGSMQRISKSHVAQVLKRLRADSSSIEAAPSNFRPAIELPQRVEEHVLQREA